MVRGGEGVASRVPDAVQRPSRCSTEPGPRMPNKMDPGLAAQHCMLRGIRGTDQPAAHNAFTIASSPSVNAAGPGCRIKGDLISTMRLLCTAGISCQPG